MKLLLDTHAFLWCVADDPRFSPRARELFSDRKNEVALSAASVWEMAIKLSLGKLHVRGVLSEVIQREVRDNGLRILPVELEHALFVSTLAFHHRDPFDRLLVAQAMTGRLTLISGDEIFDTYSVHRVW